MAGIWIVGVSDDEFGPIIAKLSMNFPVRRIASCVSALRLLRMEEPHDVPNLMIIGAQSMTQIDRGQSKVNQMAVYGYLKVIEDAIGSQRILMHVPSGSEAEVEAAFCGILSLDLGAFSDFDLKHFVASRIEMARIELAQSGPTEMLTDSNNVKVQLMDIEIGDLTVDAVTGSLFIGGEKVESLSPKEQSILKVLVNNLTETVDRQTLTSFVWPKMAISERALDSHMSRLRRKIALSHDFELVNVYGKGYALKPFRDL